MITGLDHIVLLCRDIEEGAASYQALLGAAPVWRAQSTGAATAIFSLGNTALELIAPHGDSQTANRLREIVADGAKLTSLVYQSDDLEADHRLFTRRGLEPADISQGRSTNKLSDRHRNWTRFRIPDAKMAGVKSFVVQSGEGELPKPDIVEGGVSALDHIVLATAAPERVLAMYGARLGLDLRLDRTFPDWGTRLIFFRLGGLVLEVMHRLDKAQASDAPDRLWGLSWRVGNLRAAWKRLKKFGLEASDIRPGRKPGTEVFSVKSGTLEIPTLFIAQT